MTELSATAGSEGYAACDDEAKDMQLATTTTGEVFYCSMLTSRLSRSSAKVRL